MIKVGINPIEYNSGAGTLLPENKARTGFIIKNDTNARLFFSYSEKETTPSLYSDDVSPQTTVYVTDIPPHLLYKGKITFHLQNATSGKIMVTEFFRVKKRP